MTVDQAAAPRSRLRALWSGWQGRALRLALALLPLYWLSRSVHWSAVWEGALRVGPRAIALSFLAEAGAVLVGALRWRVMLRAYGADPAKLPGVPTLVKHMMVGQYFAVLPTGVAGDAMRGYRVAHLLPSAATSYVLVFVERVAGLLGLLIVAGVAALTSPGLFAGPVAFAMNAGLVLALGAGLVAFVIPMLAARSPALRARLARLPAIGPVLARMPASGGVAGPVLAVLLSVASQLAIVLSVALLIAPLDPAATFAVCARVVPAIILVTYIPITPGGLGQRELAFVHFFGLAHVARPGALTASLLFFCVWLALSFIGGLILLYERVRGPK